MATVVLFSLGGAPGVTTLALAVAAAWPKPVPTVMVEADAAGGDIAAWRRLPVSPGLVELAAAARTDAPFADGAAAPVVLGCSQVLAGGQRVCVAPLLTDSAAGAVRLLAGHPAVLRADGVVTVVDAGRVAPRTPAASLVASADTALLVVGDDLAQLKRAQGSLPALREAVAHLGLVITGTATAAGQVHEALGVPVLQRVPADARSAAFLRGHAQPPRPYRRPLMRSARHLAERLAHTTPLTPAEKAGAR
ncbi:hypothetical protein [Streptomonospora arabica]|uniref:MinD-like ATPase involved in chromosome partitioning or flagellar assembly n=1 Tax=Streptomonospora arabica TaxID=412417 RepID=A0ABV9SK91_9ACTN